MQIYILFVTTFLVWAGDYDFTQTMYWFEHQKVDHYNKLNLDTFKQRYWTVEENFNPQTGAVLFQICGEYTCPGIMQERLFIIQLAKQFKALIIVLEHRYYGQSMPLGKDSLKDENLRFLSTRQALDDLAYFQRFMILNGKHGIKSHNPWIAIGGSYPGALAAWYRYQYPHLVIGALASSAVVKSITDFKQFDSQVYQSALKSGQECADDIQNMNKYAEEQILYAATKEAFKQSFGAEKLNDLEFLFFFADSQLLIIQYGGRTELCKQLKGKTIEQQIEYFRGVIEEDGYKEYGSYYLKQDNYDEQNLTPSRQWMYQCCSELGWWQTSPTENSVRSPLINLQFYKDFCNNIFGDNFQNIFPDEDWANAKFGGDKLEVSNLIMTNGNEDPWKWSSVLKDQGSIKAFEINCDNSGHCVELYTPQDDDCEQLKQVRTKIIGLFQQWIDEHYQK